MPEGSDPVPQLSGGWPLFPGRQRKKESMQFLIWAWKMGGVRHHGDGESLGWQIRLVVFLVNYACSLSSGYAASTSTGAYSGVPEEAAGLLAPAECVTGRDKA